MSKFPMTSSYCGTCVYVHWTVPSSAMWEGHHGTGGTAMSVVHVHVHGTVLSFMSYPMWGRTGQGEFFFFGRTLDLVSERESLLSRNPMPPHGGPVGRCMGLYADVLSLNLGVGNFFFRKELSFRI